MGREASEVKARKERRCKSKDLYLSRMRIGSEDEVKGLAGAVTIEGGTKRKGQARLNPKLCLFLLKERANCRDGER